MEDIPKEVIRDLKFKFVSHLDEVLDVALVRHIKRVEPVMSHPVFHAPAPPSIKWTRVFVLGQKDN